MVNVAKGKRLLPANCSRSRGEIKDQNGSVGGSKPVSVRGADELETCDYLVEGCIGSVSQ